MPANVSTTASGATMWLRPLALVVIHLGFAARGGRVLRESVGQCAVYSNGVLFDRFGSLTGLPLLDPLFCALLSFFREILIYPVGRALAILFLSFALPFLLNLLWRAQTRSQVFRAFLWAALGQVITFGATTALFFSSTHIPSVRDPVKSSGEFGYLAKKARPSISRKYVIWIMVVMLLTIPAFLALFFTPTENDVVYIRANGAFQLYPLVFLLALPVTPVQSNISANGLPAPYKARAAGVRLVVRMFGPLSWLSAALWWAGIVALFAKPAVANEATFGKQSETLSPIIASFLAGQWEWSIPRLDDFKGGPLFFAADMISSILAAWSSQIEAGHAPSLVQAIAFGPPFAIAKSMAKTWRYAL